jgi:hypothetical protein
VPNLAASGCAREARHEITFSDPSKPDIVTARAEGPSCAQAIVTLTIRNADGDALWAFADTYQHMIAGDAPIEPAPKPEDVERFLKSWADVTLAKTSALPEWREGDEHLTGGDSGMSYSTALGREAYEELRKRDLNEACYAIHVEGSECIVMDPFAHTPISLVRFGP